MSIDLNKPDGGPSATPASGATPNPTSSAPAASPPIHPSPAPIVPASSAPPGGVPPGQPAAPASISPAPGATSPANAVELLRGRVGQAVYDGYCSTSARARLVQSAVNDLALDRNMASIVIDLELESLCCANEQPLCDALTGMLKRFSDSDRRLDPKEREDAVQMVCRPKTGYAKGLAFDVANQTIVAYCRANHVKIKVGLLRWEVP